MEFDYTTEPKVIRIDEESGMWSIDGYDPDTDKYTEDVWDYYTQDEAIAKIEDFIKDIYGYGYKFNWPTDRAFQVGQRVYLTEDKMEGTVIGITADGNFVVTAHDPSRDYVGTYSEEFITKL